MMTQRFVTKGAIPFMILVSAAAASAVVVAYAQGIPAGPTDTAVEASGITYPVAELGNCGNKEACKAYCDDTSHMTECIAFAEQRGLMSREEAARAKTFASRLNAGEGPGGCTSPAECDAFCTNIDNIETCIAFAEEEGITDDPKIQEGKKMLAYLKGGGSTPGNCKSKTECEAYCDDFSNIEECLAFAENVGLDIGEEVGPEGGRGPGGRGGPPPRQMIEVIKSGQTPGGCKSRTECDAYCSSGEHFEECIAFAEKAGFMSADEAAKIRKTGGRGPGGCKSERECRLYCDDSLHQEECFKFAEENGLIPPEELARAKEGMVRMRQGLENAPPEVKECLRTTLGPTIIEDIQAGKLVPGPSIGERMRDCFEKFGGHGDPRDVFKNAPPEVLSCLKEKMGDEVFTKVSSGEAMPSVEMADTFRVCFQSAQFAGPMMPPGGQPCPPGATDCPPPGGPMGPPPNIGEFLRSAPPQVAACLQEKLGSELEALKSSTTPQSPEIGEKMRACFESFRPERPEFDKASGEFRDRMAPMAPAPVHAEDFAPETVQCLKQTFGEDIFQKLQVEPPGPEMRQAMARCFGMMPPQPQPGGRPGMPMPGEQVPPPGAMPGQMPPGYTGPMPPSGSDFRPPEGYRPPEGTMPSGPMPYPEGVMPPQGTMTQPPQGYTGSMPPEGFVPPTGGWYGPPPGYTGTMPPEGTMQPPPGGTYPSPEMMGPTPTQPIEGMMPMPTQPTEQPPTSLERVPPLLRLVGTLLAPFLNFVMR